MPVHSVHAIQYVYRVNVHTIPYREVLYIVIERERVKE